MAAERAACSLALAGVPIITLERLGTLRANWAEAPFVKCEDVLAVTPGRAPVWKQRF